MQGPVDWRFCLFGLIAKRENLGRIFASCYKRHRFYKKNLSIIGMFPFTKYNFSYCIPTQAPDP